MTVEPEDRRASQASKEVSLIRETWTAPVLRVLSASSAENNVGGATPDAEGTS